MLGNFVGGGVDQLRGVTATAAQGARMVFMDVMEWPAICYYTVIDCQGRGTSMSKRNFTMCLALYLAASQELPVIAWDKTNPAFHVVRLPKDADAVRKHFRSQYVYYAGSTQGCSCAFNYEHESDSIVELRNYLRNALICVSEVEMFACQSGAEAEDGRHALKTSPDGIARADFLFKDGQHVTIGPAKLMEPVTEAEKCLQQVTKAPRRPKSSCLSLLTKQAALNPLCAS